jgi:hypothetical protein
MDKDRRLFRVYRAANRLLPRGQEDYATLECYVEGVPKLRLTCDIEMQYRLVFFAWAGMSDAAVVLSWLLIQRARKLAGVCPKSRSPAAILVKHDAQRVQFWRSGPCDVEHQICMIRDEGLEGVHDWRESMRRPTAAS